MLLRLIIEKCKEWGSPCIVVSIDLERAFEFVRLSAILAHWKKRGVPVRLRYAAFKEIAGERFVRYSMGGMKTDYLPKHRGLIQGSPESSFFFSSMISDLLGDLDRDWKSRGYGAKFGKWSSVQEAWQKWISQNQHHNHDNLQNFVICILAFVDDLYFVAKTLQEAQTMTNELVAKLAEVGLRPKISKIKWTCDNFTSAVESGLKLHVNGHAIAPSQSIKVLGSMIAGDGSEREAYTHRAQQAWKTFFTWE